MKDVSRLQFVGGAAGVVALFSLPMRAWAAGLEFKNLLLRNGCRTFCFIGRSLLVLSDRHLTQLK